MALLYASERMVPSVPITPIRLLIVDSAADFAPGLITPMIGISVIFSNSGKATAEEVLQATTKILISF